MTFKINAEQAQAILNYLQNQPWKEVFQLIQMLSQLEVIEEPTTKKEEIKEK